MSTIELAQANRREELDAKREQHELELRRENEREDEEELFDEITGPWAE